MPQSSVLDIEQRALRAWPAAEVEHLDGWHLRAMAGVSRRANSAWTSEASGARTLDDRIAAVERFYAQRGLRATFQVAPTSQPQHLEKALAERGYAIEAPVLVQVARVVDVAPTLGKVRVRLDAAVSPPWFDVSAVRGRFAACQTVYRGLLERLESRAVFALAEVGGQPAAVALGVLDAPWLGISSMFTLPEYRGRGAARSILAALARWAAGRSATAMYLQVEQDNEIARALYEDAGFRTHHAYHYRTSHA